MTVLSTLVACVSGLPVASTRTVVALSCPTTGRVRRARAYLTWSGVQFGCACRMVATAPETTPAAIEVPPTLKYSPSVTHCGHRLAYSDPGESTETMWAPGAST